MKQTNESELRRLAVVLQDSNDAITMQDLSGKIIAWNRGAELMYGYSEDEALSLNIETLVPKEKRTSALAYLEKIKEGDLVESFETERVTKDGKHIIVWLIITCLRNDKGVIDSLATTERDITTIKEELDFYRKTLPMCAACKSIREVSGEWVSIEEFLAHHSHTMCSHSICPVCAQKLYPEWGFYKSKIEGTFFLVLS